MIFHSCIIFATTKEGGSCRRPLYFLLQHRRTDQARVVAESRTHNLRAPAHTLKTLFCHNFAQWLQQFFPISSHTAANYDDFRLQNIDQARKPAPRYMQ